MGKRRLYGALVALAAVLLLALQPGRVLAGPEDTGSDGSRNRFNVVMVVDASGSMASTDPDSLRFEAVKQFAGLLANGGNRLGGVVFTHTIAGTQDLVPVNNQESKEAITSDMAKVPVDGDTNIGAAIDTAVNMISKDGDPSLPSVILLLSDGNTDLPSASADELQASLDAKAKAVQNARDKGIAIYSVCLNADGSADTSEMEQISKGTGGKFREVSNADDLQDVYNDFFNLIFGTSSIDLLNDRFSDDGLAEKEFEVPALGVEEVNIVIYGQMESYEITREGTPVAAEETDGKTFTLLKIVDAMPGAYKLVVKGVPGDAIRVNMVFNTDLTVKATIEPAEGSLNPADPLVARAELEAQGELAKQADQYEGYEAELEVLDSFDEQVESVPMDLVGDHFEVSHILPEGTYNFRVRVRGNGLDRTSDVLGPLAVSSSARTEAELNNEAPKPVNDVVEETVYLLPFKDNTFELDLNTLATDDQEEPLTYKVMNSSFADGDYTVDESGMLHLTNFSISPGAFTVRAVDIFGLSCDIEVVVTSHNVGLMALIGLGIAAVAGLIALGVIAYYARTKPFRGEIMVELRSKGSTTMPKTVNGRRGRLPLTRFELAPTNLDYTKSYFQATGDRYVLLRTNVPVSYNGTKGREVRIESGVRMSIQISEGSELIVRFQSSMRPGTSGKRRGGGGRPNGPSRGSQGGFRRGRDLTPKRGRR